MGDAHREGRDSDFATVADLVKSEQDDGTGERWFDGSL